MIVSPVSRDLLVADPACSAAFYRDVLGLGSIVNIDFRKGSSPPQSIFIETSDVAALRESIAARGAAPSEIQRVNWIKMEMFEVRDPDGHALWFGQSFNRDTIDMHTSAGRGQLRAMHPMLPHSDVAAGIAHYRDVLGFTINYAQDDLAVMDRDSVRILLVARGEKFSGIGACSAYVRHADALYAELAGRGANVQGEPVSHPWGLRDFRVLDLEGNELTFGQTFE